VTLEIGRELMRRLAQDEIVGLSSLGSLLLQYKSNVELRLGLSLPIAIPRGVRLRFAPSKEFLVSFFRGKNSSWFSHLVLRRLKRSTAFQPSHRRKVNPTENGVNKDKGNQANKKLNPKGHE
jgi:hypothetical protein